MAHEVETMFSARETPWHGIGTVTPDVLTAADAITLGGLDWTVEKEPIFIGRAVADENGVGTEYVAVPRRFALTRSTDQRVMTICSDVYRPFQNRDAFTFMDMLVDSGDAKYETAGSLRGGRVIFLSMHVPMDILVAGEDRHEAFLLLRTTHDGSGRISVYVVIVRVVCMNTLTLALSGASHSWGVTHTADVKGKVAEARDALGMTFKYSEQFRINAEALIDVKVTDDDIVKLLEGVMPMRAKRDAVIEEIVEHHRTSETVGNFRDTGWGFLNAFSEYEEHVRDSRSGEAKLARLLDGGDAKARTVLSRRLLARR